MFIDNYFKALDNNYILILTSNSKERDAISKSLGKVKRLHTHLGGFSVDVGVVGGVFFVHLSGESGFTSNNSVAHKCQAFVSDKAMPKPALVILSGICWGDPLKVKLNDTILSDHIITANQREVSIAGDTKKTRHFYSEFNLDTFISLDFDNIHLGSLISAETLIKSDSVRDEYLSCDSNALGGEMEAFALIPSLTNVKWLVVKTVSDYASATTHNRETQVDYCQKLADDIHRILPVIISCLGGQFKVSSSESLVLHDIISGNRLDFNISSINLREINDHLNDHYGPVLLRKINNYIDGEVFKADFGYKLAGLLLEMVQNSFRHNNSTSVGIVFNDKSISVETNNDIYNIESIEGKHGGAIAWNKIKVDYVDTGKITISASTKRIQFSFGKLLDKMNEIKSKCYVNVVLGQSGYSGYKPTLEFSEACDSVYIDMTAIIMPSRAISILEGVRNLVSQGKIVYIKTRDDFQRLEYMKIVGEESNNIKLIY
ncbi:hypothetical protein [Raoultella terrigena]|uniref:hypothetical protein n=1 Tax=Raoultella terrigena TaxID=577 RepID=UPI00385062DD